MVGDISLPGGGTVNECDLKWSLLPKKPGIEVSVVRVSRTPERFVVIERPIRKPN